MQTKSYKINLTYTWASPPHLRLHNATLFFSFDKNLIYLEYYRYESPGLRKMSLHKQLLAWGPPKVDQELQEKRITCGLCKTEGKEAGAYMKDILLWSCWAYQTKVYQSRKGAEATTLHHHLTPSPKEAILPPCSLHDHEVGGTMVWLIRQKWWTWNRVQRGLVQCSH